jgi:FMN phosphatase YigB (HAD superfamily)
VTLTLLLDLDDTLLANDIQSFLPHYLHALSAHMAAFAEPDSFVRTLMHATAQMNANPQPDRTLAETFSAYFFPHIAHPEEEVRQAFEDFYNRVFPTLKNLTHPIPVAQTLVHARAAQGDRLVIATNPYFPSTAIHQRLDWAGLSPDTIPYALVPCYETFHYAKPNPAYYAELLSQLGWQPGPIVVLGNDWELDIQPALALGLAAYWLSDQPPADTLPPNSPFGWGTLEQAAPWLDQFPRDWKPNYNFPPAIQAILAATPAALATLTRSLPPEKWTSRPQPGEWSLTEIICHLRDVEREVYQPRLERILNETTPFIQSVNSDPWAEERDYLHQDGARALKDFTVARIQTLDTLAAIQPEDWLKPARHTIFGPTHLQELFDILAGHDRLHLRQAYPLITA